LPSTTPPPSHTSTLSLHDALPIFALSPVFIGVQALLGRVPSARRPLTDLGWSFLRLLVAFSYVVALVALVGGASRPLAALYLPVDRKSTRLNSSHDQISYAVFCLK